MSDKSEGSRGSPLSLAAQNERAARMSARVNRPSCNDVETSAPATPTRAKTSRSWLSRTPPAANSFRSGAAARRARSRSMSGPAPLPDPRQRHRDHPRRPNAGIGEKLRRSLKCSHRGNRATARPAPRAPARATICGSLCDSLRSRGAQIRPRAIASPRRCRRQPLSTQSESSGKAARRTARSRWSLAPFDSIASRSATYIVANG